MYAHFKVGVFLCVLGHTDVSVGTSVGGCISMRVCDCVYSSQQERRCPPSASAPDAGPLRGTLSEEDTKPREAFDQCCLAEEDEKEITGPRSITLGLKWVSRGILSLKKQFMNL